MVRIHVPPQQMPDIAILTGGDSSEREVSLKTSSTIKKALDALGYKYLLIDIADTNWQKSLSGNTAILALHGAFGEDGEIQKILEKKHTPFTGSGSKQSETAFNKKLSKMLVSKLRIDCPPNYSLLDDIPFPAIVKPNQEGSSYGISIVNKKSDLLYAIDIAKSFSKEILIEEYINGTELSCAVTEITGSVKALPVIEIIPNSVFFDYKSKYSTNGAKEIVPARIDKQLAEEIQKKSEKIFKEFDLRQYARIDWIVKDNIPYFIEVNTLPGMTATSLINKELYAKNISIEKFVSFLISTASY